MARGGKRKGAGNKKGNIRKPHEEKKSFFSVGIKNKYLQQGKQRVLELANVINNTPNYNND